jgi:hypothetical protein
MKKYLGKEEDKLKSSSCDSIVRYFTKELILQPTKFKLDIVPDLKRKRIMSGEKEQKSSKMEQSPITEDDQLLLDDENDTREQQMDTSSEPGQNVPTPTSSMIGTIITTDETKEKKSPDDDNKKTKVPSLNFDKVNNINEGESEKTSDEVTPPPGPSKAPFLEAKKFAEKISRSQSLVQFLEPFQDAKAAIPQMFIIRFRPIMGIEDDNFIGLWKEAMNKTSKWLMNRSIEQAELHQAKMKKTYGDALTTLSRVATAKDFEVMYGKIDSYKREKFDFFLKQREERQKNAADKSEKLFKSKNQIKEATPKEQRKTDRYYSSSRRDLRTGGRDREKRQNSSRERSTSKQPQNKKRRDDDTRRRDQDDEDATSPNPRYLGKNYDPNYRAKNRGSKPRDTTSYRQDKRRQKEYEHSRYGYSDQDAKKTVDDPSKSQQELFKKFLSYMNSQKE